MNSVTTTSPSSADHVIDRLADQPADGWRSRFASGPAIVLYLAAAKLLLHLLTAGRYGIFRDEMYYVSCSEHLDWGYVDHPPLIAVVTWIARHVFGQSSVGLRLLPALAGAALVWLTGKLAREMGGGRFAQGLAALAVVAAPLYLIMHHWLTMNAFEPLIWMGCAWCVLRAINTGQSRYWLWFGVLVGVGMENKYSVGFFAIGVFVGLLLTPEHRFLKSRWMWIGALAGFLIFLPNLVWLARHDFPFLELMQNVRRTNGEVARGPVAFIADQVVIMNPVLFPLWAGGLAWLMFAPDGRRYRVLGWTFLVVLTIFITLKGKNYYVVPVYPMLFAAGAVEFERVPWRRPASLWIRSTYIVLLLAATAVLAPIFAPILSPETLIRYQRAVHIEPKAENQRTGPLPQYLADEFGWEEMTRETARVYNTLSPAERAKTAIFASSYEQAGAIDYFGPKYGLPKAISNHQSYWYWGPHDYTGEIVIVLGSTAEDDREHFRSVEAAGRAYHPYSREDEHFDIFVCRGFTGDLREIWPTMKKWQ